MAHFFQKWHSKRSKSVVGGNQKAEKLKSSRAWRVLAAYLAFSRKDLKEEKRFSVYLKEKPVILTKELPLLNFDNVDLTPLFNETTDILGKVTRASAVTMYLVDQGSREIYKSRLPDDDERFRIRWKIQDGTTVAAYTALKKEYVLIDDILCDIRFPDGVGYEGCCPAKSVMCLPIMTPDGDCMAVMELYRDFFKSSFQQDDLTICAVVTAWMGLALHQNQERLALKRQQEVNEYLLDLIKFYFEDNVLVEKLMSEVIQFAKIALGAERGSYFIIDQESDELVAHSFDEHSEVDAATRKMKLRYSQDQGIAGQVARAGETINVKDAYEDNRFKQENDNKNDFITRSILCTPILRAQETLGVIQVVNKRKGGYFTENDENLLKTISFYCTLALHYTNVHTHTNRKNHLNNLHLKMVNVMYKPCIHDIEGFIIHPQVRIPPDFNSFSWYIKPEQLEKAPQYVLYMFLQLIKPSEMNLESLMQFILTTRKLYHEENPYHNFEHAFSVCHCMYLILRLNWDKFSAVENKALLVACLCHDLDHGGYTNNFLTLTKDDIAELYESSVLEHHHWFVTQLLLKDYNIFPTLSNYTYNFFLKDIRDAIIATDLAVYFERRLRLAKSYSEKSFRWCNETDRSLVRSIMMNTCDLSAQCKPFLTALRITENVYREFYHEGDLEKQMNLCPLSIMDRDKEDHVPADQIKFLNVVVIPCTEQLKVVLSNTEDLYQGAVRLRDGWLNVLDTREEKVWRQNSSIICI